MQKYSCLLVLLLVAGCADPAADITLSSGWVRSPPPGMSMTAGFGVIENHSAKAVTIVAVASASGLKTEIHQTRIENEVARMRPVAALVIPPRGTVAMAPGGFHLMIMNLKQPLAEGDAMDLSLVDDQGRHWPVHLQVSDRSPDVNRGAADH